MSWMEIKRQEQLKELIKKALTIRIKKLCLEDNNICAFDECCETCNKYDLYKYVYEELRRK